MHIIVKITFFYFSIFTKGLNCLHTACLTTVTILLNHILSNLGQTIIYINDISKFNKLKRLINNLPIQ